LTPTFGHELGHRHEKRPVNAGDGSDEFGHDAFLSCRTTPRTPEFVGP
jgi:hypothetical protein